MTERYVFIQDNDSIDIFKDNIPCKFKVQLNIPSNFEGYWKVALCEISLQRNRKIKRKKSDNTLFIYSNISKESIVKSGEHALLRRINQSASFEWQYIFDNPFYLPLKRSEFQEIEFIIKTSDDELASFLASPVFLTLHFKRYPFFSSYESI